VRISDRFLDNGVTGGLFLAGQLILLALWGLTGLIKPLIDLTVSIFPQSTVNALLAALGISSIFFFGLLLDLLATGFPPFIQKEIISMKSHLDHNQDWLRCIEDEDAYFKKGSNDFVTDYNGSSSSDVPNAKTPPPGSVELQRSASFKRKKSNRNLYISLIHQWMERRKQRNKSDKTRQDEETPEEKLIVNYYRLRYFFNSYVLLNSGISQLDTLSDQVHWWRASRAICIATLYWACEPLIVPFIWLAAVLWFRQPLPHPETVVWLFLSWVVLFLLTFLTFNITNIAFARMCSTLFSLTRVTYVKKKSERSAAEQQQRNAQ
jgi:hypothetical protein